MLKHNKYLKKVLKEMCKRVGADYDKIDFKKDDWFSKYEWTEKEQDNFEGWLVGYLQRNKKAREKMMNIPAKAFSKKIAVNFIFAYGWKLKM